MRFLASALALSFAACTTAEPPPPRTSASILAAPAPSPCALGVAGARVMVEDTNDGVALAFTAPSQNVADLRQRAADAAALYGPGAHAGKGHDGHHGDGGKHGLQPFQMPPARGEASDIEGGARIRLVPAVPADLEPLRAKVRARAKELNDACN